MAVLTLQDLRNQLKLHRIEPVYLLYGPETHIRDIAAKTITERAFAPGDLRDFNETSFSLNTEDNLNRALAAAEQLPMMASRRVVRITDIRVSATGHRDNLTEHHEAALAAYLSKPAPHSVVIFIADDLNGVRKVSKLLKASAAAVEFVRLDDREMAKWARDRIKEEGAEISDTDLRALISRMGPDVNRLTNEISKLVSAALPGKTITLELIEALVPYTREINNFDLTGHLVAGRKAQALTTLQKILDDGAEPLALLGLISYNYRRLLMAKELMSRGVDRREVASIAKLRYNDQETFLSAARRADTRKLIFALKRLAGTDLAIKTSIGGGGPTGPRLQIEMLVCELAML